ncbi:cytochrome P450 [Amylocystis lapponica]|nr:cytochrome P450 [Amylocystis lapponica]
MQAYLFILPFIGLYLFRWYLEFRKAVRSIRDFPGFRSIFDPANHLFSKRIRGIAYGNSMSWLTKHQDFVDCGLDIYSAEVTSSRMRFQKPLWHYKVISFFGSNIVVTEGDEWKRHRKIAAPAFSERNNRLVWDESMRTMLDLFENIWGEQQEINIDHIVDLTVPIALFIIGVAGFGRRIAWSEDGKLSGGHIVTFKDALHTVSNDLVLKVVLPNWVLNWGPTKRVRNFKVAYDELERYMIEMIQARKKSEKKEERYDLFSSLLDANEDELDGQGSKLSDSELIGTFCATTAHTLAYTFIMLALYQDEQEILYQHVKSVFRDGRIPAYEEMGQLSYSLAVFLETLRMFPPVCNIPKYAAEDATLVTRNTAGEPVQVVIPQGAQITIHTPGLHYNPRRFLGDWPRDAFLPFSGGARSCLGRKFSETEGVAILSLLISATGSTSRRNRSSLRDVRERKARLLKSKSAITLYPVRAPLVFTRR